MEAGSNVALNEEEVRGGERRSAVVDKEGCEGGSGRFRGAGARGQMAEPQRKAPTETHPKPAARPPNQTHVHKDGSRRDSGSTASRTPTRSARIG